MCSQTHGPLFSEGQISGVDFQRSFGFDPKLPQLEFHPIEFDLARVQESLFGGTYRNPVTLLFSRDAAERRRELSTDIELHVRLAQALYIGELDELYCYDRPEWYLRGVGRFRGPTGELEAATTIVHLAMDDDDHISAAIVQVMVDPARLNYTT